MSRRPENNITYMMNIETFIHIILSSMCKKLFTIWLLLYKYSYNLLYDNNVTLLTCYVDVRVTHLSNIPRNKAHLHTGIGKQQE